MRSVIGELNGNLTFGAMLPDESSKGESPTSSILRDIALSNEERKQIYAYSSPMELKKKQILYFQGDCDDRLYVLMKGVVKLTKFMHDGREYIMDIMGENSAFGQIPEFETVGGDTAVAMEDGLVHILDSRGYKQLSKNEPQLSARLRRTICFRRERRERKLIDLLSCTVEQRLAKVFINLCEDFGVCRNGGYLLKAGLTHSDFADLIASTRETVTVKLNKFIREKRIEYEGRYILIKSFREISSLAK